MKAQKWCVLIINLPGQSGTPRVRLWRAMKACGAGLLRDGVYVLPESREVHELLQEQVINVQEAGGTAFLLTYSPDDSHLEAEFRRLFDRSADYAEWLGQVGELIDTLASLDEPEARRKETQLRRKFEGLTATDYFPDEARERAERGLKEMTAAINARFSPDEPTAGTGGINPCNISEYRGRRWATRHKLWVDRMASAWLIQRFIDPEASFVWLSSPSDCPDDAIGFDYDGAPFTHVGDLVTFEVLIRSFDLTGDPALIRLGALVHYVDVGGVPVTEADGFILMLAGIKHQCKDDDSILSAAIGLLDHLYAAYTHSTRQEGTKC